MSFIVKHRTKKCYLKFVIYSYLKYAYLGIFLPFNSQNYNLTPYKSHNNIQ